MRDVLLVLLGGALAFFWQLTSERLLFRLLRPKKAKRLVILPLKGDNADLERLLRWELFCLEEGLQRGERLLAAVDMGLGRENAVLAKKLLSDRKNTIFCDSENLSSLIADDVVYKELEVVLY